MIVPKKVKTVSHYSVKQQGKGSVFWVNGEKQGGMNFSYKEIQISCWEEIPRNKER